MPPEKIIVVKNRLTLENSIAVQRLNYIKHIYKKKFETYESTKSKSLGIVHNKRVASVT